MSLTAACCEAFQGITAATTPTGSRGHAFPSGIGPDPLLERRVEPDADFPVLRFHDSSSR